LGFKEKHALETLPGRIETLARELLLLEEKLADPALFSRDPKAFAKATERHAAAAAEKSAAEEQWLELEMLREELEGA
jgi:ATP-binding cassette subfamily F protein uup